MRFTVKNVALYCLFASASVGFCQTAKVGNAAAGKAETIKIAFIDGISGPFANIGLNMLRSHQFVADRLTPSKGLRVELVPFDSKGSPQEAINALKAATDQGIRYITQGNSSAIAAALIDAINKYNERNPGKELVFFNYAAVDPDLTNAKCSYWHFRFDADSGMKMEAMTTFMKDDTSVKNVYLINQNYSHGQQVSRAAREMLALKRPDVKVVGDDLHPVGQVKDFAPYIAKIKAAGADSVITGNWGADLTLLIKAAKESGLNINFYTYYAGAQGTPAAIGDSSEGKVKVIYVSNVNMPELLKAEEEYATRYKEDFSVHTVWHLYTMLPAAVAKAKSTDPLAVAKAMEGLSVKSFSGDITMRASDHQLQQALYMSSWHKTDAKNPLNLENTGFTWVQDKKYEPYVSSTPTSCQMKRPA